MVGKPNAILCNKHAYHNYIYIYIYIYDFTVFTCVLLDLNKECNCLHVQIIYKCLFYTFYLPNDMRYNYKDIGDLATVLRPVIKHFQ